MGVYNGKKYLGQQIESVLKQNFHNWHLYIRDDGSDDGSKKVIKDFAEKYPKKITDLSFLEGGGSSTKNFFVILKWVKNNTDSDYFMFADQDDYWLPFKIEICLKQFLSNKPILVHTDLRVVDSSLKTINSSYIKMSNLDPYRCSLSNILVQNKVTGCTMMWNKKLNDLIDYDNVSKIAMHDWWIALIAAAFGEIRFVNKPTILYRQHQNNVVGARKKNMVNYIFSYSQIQESLNRSIAQALSFYFVYEFKLSDRDKDVVENYGKIREQKKIARITIILKFGLTRDSFIQKIGQIICI